jgi:hypothetical protein
MNKRSTQNQGLKRKHLLSFTALIKSSPRCLPTNTVLFVNKRESKLCKLIWFSLNTMR